MDSAGQKTNDRARRAVQRLTLEAEKLRLTLQIREIDYADLSEDYSDAVNECVADEIAIGILKEEIEALKNATRKGPSNSRRPGKPIV
jgi:hypothetical protein